MRMKYHARQERVSLCGVNPLMVPTLFICSCHMQTAMVTKDVSKEGSTEDGLGTLEVRKFLLLLPGNLATTQFGIHHKD